jgi:acyl-CoA dehydrogenase
MVRAEFPLVLGQPTTQDRRHMTYLLPVANDRIGDEQGAFADTVQKWAEREVMARRQTLREDYDKLLRPALGGLLQELGLQGHLWPESAGGDGETPRSASMTLALALEQVGRADTGIGFVAASGLAVAATIVDGADEVRAAELAGSFMGGEATLVAPVLGCLESRDDGLLLPDGRSLQATARRDGEQIVLDGKDVRPLCCGLDARLYAVLCRLEGGVGLLLVPGESAGIRRGEQTLQTGLAACRNAPVTFSDVRVPAGLLAVEGDAVYGALRTWLCLGLSAVCSGALLATCEILEDWAESRVIKGRGQRFVDNPLVAEVMAGVVQRTTLTRMAVRDLARTLTVTDQPGQSLLTALTVAHHAATTADEGLGRTMELMGSAGYATEWNLERYWRDIKTLHGHLGSEVLDRLEIARHCFGHGQGGARP